MSGARLELVGIGSDSFVSESCHDSTVSAAGEVDSVIKSLGRSSVAAVPIKQGSGTRYKIIEALACHVPVVSTTLGAEGLNLISGEACLVADSSGEFAHSVISVLKNRELGDRLARNGYEVFCRDYTLTANAERLRDIVLNVRQGV